MATISQIRFIYQSFIDRAYQCSLVAPPGGEWCERSGERSPLLGVYSITFGVVVECLYVLCISAIWRLRDFTCYKIMLFLCVIDMVALSLCAIFTGIFLIEGTVYCARPALIHTLGALATGTYTCSCMTCLTLSTARLVEISQHVTRIRVPKGSAGWLLLIPSAIYGLMYGLFTPPVLFSSKRKAWFFDPFIGLREYKYESWPHMFNNVAVVFMTCVVYVAVFVVIVVLKIQADEIVKRQNISTRSAASHHSILLQCSLVVGCNLIASVIYAYMQFFLVHPSIIVAATLGWQFVHAIPVFVYLSLNRSVREGVLRSLRGLRCWVLYRHDGRLHPIL